MPSVVSFARRSAVALLAQGMSRAMRLVAATAVLGAASAPAFAGVAEEHAVLDAFRERVRDLRSKRDWAGLTRLVVRLRREREDLGPGVTALHIVYATLQSLSKESAGSDIRRLEEDADAWHAANPREPAPLLVHAWLALHAAAAFNVNLAAAPGKAKAGTPPWYAKQAASVARTRTMSLDEARRWLARAERCTARDPQLWGLRIWMANLENAPRAEVEADFRNSWKLDPEFLTSYYDYMLYLHPDQHGKPGDWQAFVSGICDEMRRDDLFAMFFFDQYHASGDARAPRITSAEWQRIVAGFVRLEQKYPGSKMLANRKAFLALKAGQRAAAKAAFAEIGADWDSWTWGSKEEFEKARRKVAFLPDTWAVLASVYAGYVAVLGLASLILWGLARRADRRDAGRRPSANVHAVTFKGDPGALFQIMVANLVLTVVTLGVYVFWGRARTRRYLWSATVFERDPLAFHGIGSETLKGFAKALLMFGVPYGILAALPQLARLGLWARMAVNLGSLGLVMVFVPFAVVGARRYRLTRTSWRGIRFGYTGRPFDYARTFWREIGLLGLTLGVRSPWYRAATWGHLWARSTFGSRSFAFSGRPRELLRASLIRTGIVFGGLMIPLVLAMVLAFHGHAASAGFILLLLVSPALAATAWVLVWYRLVEARWVWAHTRFRTARFEWTPSLTQYAYLQAGNYFILLVSLGIAWPWAQVRTGRFYARHLRVVGDLDLQAVRPASRESLAASAAGEDYSVMLGLDLDLG